MIWLISKLKDSFKLHTNGMLVGALISFAITLATVTTGITLAIPENLIFGILVIGFCIVLASAPAMVFSVFIVFYMNSPRIDENSVRFIEQQKM